MTGPRAVIFPSLRKGSGFVMQYTLKWFVFFLAVMGAIGCQEQGRESLLGREKSLGRVEQAVVGGQVDNRIPAVGALVANQRSFCTGTLIASRLVITAAHCITAARQYKNARQTVRFQIDTPTGQGTNFQSAYYDADLLETHPQYGNSSGGIVNDLGYMTLTKDVTGVTPVPIHTGKMDNSWVGRKILFLGYGLIQTQPQTRSPGRKYGAEITLRQVSTDRIQTQDQGVSICSGDSGGPGLYKIGTDYAIVAVNSYVTGRTSGGQPLCDGAGWSFRVDYFVSWLQPLINQYGGSCKADTDCGPCYRCDTQQNKCVLKGTAKAQEYCRPCNAPAQCGGSGQNLCQRQSVGNRCLQACDANNCCPLGTSCQLVGGLSQCVPDKNVCEDVTCTSDQDCGPGEGCQGGVCRPKPVQASPQLCKKCATDADCGTGICTGYTDGKYCTMPCVAENFCPSGYTCQVVSGKSQCVSTTKECKCAVNTDCHTGFVCQSGVCQKQGGGKYGDACSSSRPCAAAYSCVQSQSGNVCIQLCEGDFANGQPGAACGANGSCSAGSQCYGLQGIGYACLQACTSDSSCQNGGSCQRLGSVSLCICQADSDCKNGTVCNNSLVQSFGQCAPKNTKPTQCEAGYACTYSGSSNYCLPAPSQEAGQECGGTLRCKAGHFCAQTEGGGYVCIRECNSNTDCQPEGGSCFQSSGYSFCNCNSSACSPGYVCKAISSRNKVCTKNSCQSDADCGDGMICKNSQCEKPATGCLSDINCDPGKYCVNGACVECRTDADCATGLQCTQNTCQKKTETCFSDTDCVAGQICQRGTCVNRPGCASDPDCPANYVCRDTQCIPADACKTQQDCPAGKICEFGVCVPNRSPESAKESVPSPDAGSVDQNVSTDQPTTNLPKDDVQVPISKGCGCEAHSSLLSGSLGWWMVLLMLPLLGWFRHKRRNEI